MERRFEQDLELASGVYVNRRSKMDHIQAIEETEKELKHQYPNGVTHAYLDWVLNAVMQRYPDLVDLNMRESIPIHIRSGSVRAWF